MTLPAEIVARVSRRLVEHAGLELPTWVVEARTLARIAAVGCDADAYAELIATARGTAELEELIEVVRVGESSLFRHRQQIATLVEAVVPALRERKRRVVQVWSAGCAAGQEPYTLAAVLSRALPGVQLSIVATDVSADALEAARANAYPRDALDDVPEEFRDAFVVDPVRDVVRVRPDIAALVRFERANLVEPRRGDTENGRFDVVWCRNVLIYFSVEARRRAIERLIASTTFGGFIFVGYSESLRDIVELDPLRFADAIYYRRRAPLDGPRVVSRPSAPNLRDSAPVLTRLATPPAGMPAVRPTPPAGLPIAAKPVGADREILALTGSPDPRAVTALLAARFAEAHARVVIDLDGAELLDDALAPVLRRGMAAARAAGGELVLRATRTGARRWLTRHGLDPIGGAP